MHGPWKVGPIDLEDRMTLAMAIPKQSLLHHYAEQEWHRRHHFHRPTTLNLRIILIACVIMELFE